MTPAGLEPWADALLGHGAVAVPTALTRVRALVAKRCLPGKRRDPAPTAACTATQNSATGTRTRVARVRAVYPNQLGYSGHVVRLRARTHRHRHQTTSWPEGRGDCLRHTADLRTVRRRGRTKLQHIRAAPCPLGQHTGNLSSQRLVLEKVVRPTCARRGHSTTRNESAPGSAAQSTRLWLRVCVLLSACDLRQRGRSTIPDARPHALRSTRTL